MQIVNTLAPLAPVAPAAPAAAPAALVAPSAPTAPDTHAHAAPGAGIAAGPAHPMETVIDPSTVKRGASAQGIDASATRPGLQDPAKLQDAVSKVKTQDGTARLAVDEKSNTATFLAGSFDVKLQPGVGGTGPDRVARTFLGQNGTLFGVNDPNEQLQLLDVMKDDLGFNHAKYQQVQAGLPVFGQQIVVHSKDARITSVAGRITPNIVGDATPKFDGAEAARRALESTRQTLGAANDPVDGELVAGKDQQLGWYTLADGTPHLAYGVEVSGAADQRWQMYVDAQSGDVLDRWALVHSALNRETTDAKTGKVTRKEDTPPVGDAPLDAAHDGAKDVYDFYSTLFGRDSIDGKGMTLKSTVHYGTKYNNAFWDGSKMTYGDGDGKMFIPFSLGVDVVGHEMTHGVTERSAGLRYQRQSGALNESWSDVFGNLIEKWAEKRDGKAESDPKWLIGEAIFTPDVAGDGLRSMSQPGTGYKGDPQPGHMKDYKDTFSDNGGVHTNSGIPNKAAYEVAQSIGGEKLARVWYRALTSYLTPGSQFSDAANVTVQSAIDLYGAGSAEAKAVADAWTGVGLTPTVSPGAPTPPPA